MYQNGSERYLAVLGIDRTANAMLCHVMTSSELVKNFIILGQNSSKLATAKLRNPIMCLYCVLRQTFCLENIYRTGFIGNTLSETQLKVS